MKIKSLLALVLFAFAIPAFAVTSGGTYSRVRYSVTPIGTTAYLELFSSTSRGIANVSVVNTGSNPIALAFGASGSEVQQMVVPPTNASVTAPQVYPLAAGYATRISAISLSGTTGGSGELEVNLFYN